jgi:hypothetical protein
LAQVKFDWASGGARTYERTVERKDSEAGVSAQAFSEEVRVDQGKLVTALSARSFSVKPPQWTIGVPEQFVPGPFLPAALGAIRAGEGIILRTDAYPDCEGLPMLEPWLLIVKAGSEAETTVGTTQTASGSPRIAESAGDLRSISVEVNGSGRRSRWYFKADGSVAYIDSPGGVRRLRTERKTVEELFAEDPEMRVGSEAGH